MLREEIGGADSGAPALPPAYCSRPRLLGLLDGNRPPLTILDAPAGSGKTSVLSEWAQESASRVHWLTLDSGFNDGDPVLESIRHEVGVGDGRPQALAEAIDAHAAVLVVDDFHFATPVLAAALTSLARRLQRGRVILATRAAGAVATVSGVQSDITVISADELSFTPREVGELQRHLTTEPVGPRTQPTVSQLLDLTHGHPLLTRLAIDLGDRLTLARLRFSAADWAASTVPTDQLPEAMRMALLPQVTEPSRSTAFDGDARATIDRLAREGLGSVNEHGSFTFHHPLLFGLRAYAERHLPVEEQRRVQASWASHLPVPQPARTPPLSLFGAMERFRAMLFRDGEYVDAEALQDAATILGSLPSVIAASPTLAAAIEAVSHSVRETTPSLGVIQIAEAALDAARSGSAPRADEAGVVHEIAILALLWSARRYDDAADQIERVRDLSHAVTLDPDSPVWAAAQWGLLYGAVTLTLAGKLDRAEQVLDDLEHDAHPARAERRLIQRALIHTMRGEVSSAAKLLDAHTFHPTLPPQWHARLAIAQAAIVLEKGEPERARAILRAIEEDLPLVQEWPYSIIVTSRTHIATDPVTGMEDIDRLLRVHRNRPVSRGVRDLLHSAVADHALAARDIPRAKAIVAPRKERDVALRLSAARLALISADPDAADDMRRLTARRDVWPRLRAQAFLLLAVHLHRAGAAGAGQALAKALAITTNHQIRLIHALIPRSELEEIAREQNLELPSNVNHTNPLELPLARVQLTRREAHLLHLLQSHASLTEIAADEFVSLSTIKTQTASIYKKLGVSSRREAIDEARTRGLVE